MQTYMKTILLYKNSITFNSFPSFMCTKYSWQILNCYFFTFGNTFLSFDLYFPWIYVNFVLKVEDKFLWVRWLSTFGSLGIGGNYILSFKPKTKSHFAKDFLIVKKIQPILIPSKIIAVDWVDLNSKINFAICHWSWEIGCILHFLRKYGDITLAIQ